MTLPAGTVGAVRTVGRTRAVVALAALAAAGALVAVAPPARACSCGGTAEDETPARLARAEAAFVGRVVGVDGEVTTLEVERALTTAAAPTVELERRTSDPDCAPLPAVGERVAFLVARRDGGGWIHGACAQANPVEVLAAARLARTGPTTTAGDLRTEAIVGAALVLAGASLVAASRVRARHDPASP